YLPKTQFLVHARNQTQVIQPFAFVAILATLFVNYHTFEVLRLENTTSQFLEWESGFGQH
ncbi:MAG: hypothetical protein AAF587_43235, partial [Bacteroidota bacterium]